MIKLFVALMTILNIGAATSVKPIKKLNNTIVFKISSLDEELLKTEFYKKGEKAYLKPIIKINKNQLVKNKDSVVISLDFQTLHSLILSLAAKSGLLNGNTRYEKIGKDNIFIEAKFFLNANIETKFKNNNKRIERIFSATKNQLLLEETPQLNLRPMETINQLNIILDPDFEKINFSDKRKVVINRQWGYINYGTTENEMSLYDLFLTGENMSDNETETYNKVYDNFIDKLNIELKENHRPYSDDYDITYANQGSEKKSLFKGYNIKLKINQPISKPLFPINLLLLPLLLIVGPFVYFSLRKFIKK